MSYFPIFHAVSCFFCIIVDQYCISYITTYLRSALSVVRYGLEELDAGGFDLPAGLVVGLRRDGHGLPGHEGSSRQGQSGRNGTALELQVVLFILFTVYLD